ncbi:RNA-binding cell elongation regulator Jag/EloR [Alteribacillus iranensis]|uniref:RNA-binding protein KhpB n=1 Tax=Alteribacillus iranensis TaxID=930128 RepID=A0A1I2C5F4_9BACI|nr:RNA-binding cell elongation regulator Jag/EloR [Alteribacillus iranensis]SFE63559.1 spoIIIJ-associated protein [Alteribacillus iranensis]
MNSVKVSGKTVEDAVREALKQLGTDKVENVEYKVLEEPTKGFLGIIGGKDALLEATLKAEPEEEALAFLQDILQQMKVRVDVEMHKNGRETEFLLSGEDLGVIIGKRGKTLDSLQYLVNLAANRTSGRYTRIILDAENYRKRRQEALEQLAERLASKVERTGLKELLEPMNARERKIIHSALQNRQGVLTRSEGTEPHRYIVIYPEK